MSASSPELTIAAGIVRHLGGLSPEWVTILLAALPISELRGAIPAGVAMGLPLWRAVLLAIVGNLAPVVPLLVGLRPMQRWVERIPFGRRFVTWLNRQTAARADLVRRYEALGLAAFVAVPLPMTGAWTGCVAAVLFRLPFAYSILALVAGVVTAAGIVGFLTWAATTAWH